MSRMVSGMPILPTSCSGATWRIGSPAPVAGRGPGQLRRHAANPVGVLAGVVVAILGGDGEPLQDVELRLRQLVCALTHPLEQLVVDAHAPARARPGSGRDVPVRAHEQRGQRPDHVDSSPPESSCARPTRRRRAAGPPRRSADARAARRWPAKASARMARMSTHHGAVRSGRPRIAVQIALAWISGPDMTWSLAAAWHGGPQRGRRGADDDDPAAQVGGVDLAVDEGRNTCRSCPARRGPSRRRRARTRQGRGAGRPARGGHGERVDAHGARGETLVDAAGPIRCWPRRWPRPRAAAKDVGPTVGVGLARGQDHVPGAVDGVVQGEVLARCRRPR